MLDGYMTINDFAKKKGVTRRTVYNWISSGKLDTKVILGHTIVKDK